MATILVLDTATGTPVVGIVAGGATVAERHAAGEAAAATRRLLLLVAETLDAAGATLDDIDEVLVGCGPGSFTGLRIGLATAAGIAAARGLPLSGVSTLDALVGGADDATAVIDARRRQVFALGPGAEAGAYDPARVPVPATGGVALGDGALAYRTVLEAAGFTIPDDRDPRHRPSAATLAAAPRRSPDAIYLREPDAVPFTGAT